MTTALSAGIDVETPSRPLWLPVIIVAMAQTSLVFNITAVKVSIEDIASTFSASASSVTTAIVVYCLVVAALILVGAKIAPSYGARRIFKGTVALFAAAMALMSVSANTATVILAQVVAGVATALMVPTLAVLIADHYIGAHQTTALGWLAAAQAMGVVPAFLVAGALTTWLSWRLAFGLLVPWSLVIYLLAGRLRPTAVRSRARIDKVGLMLVILAIFLIGVGCNNLTDWGALLARPRAPFSLLHLSPAPLVIICGMFLIKAFFLWSRRVKAAGGTPLVSLDAFSGLPERSLLLSIFTVGVLGAAITFVVPMYIEVVQGRTSVYTAVACIPFTVASFLAAIFVVRLRGRVHPRQIARAAFLGVAFGATLLGATIRYGWGNAMVITGMILAGFGEGALATLLLKLLLTRASADVTDEIPSLCGTTDYFAAAVGTALASALVIGVLGANIQRELGRSPAFTGELLEQLNLDSVAFISNDFLQKRLSGTTATPDQVTEAVRINTQARLRALRVCFFALSGLAALAFLPAAALPDYDT
jgi:MFS family permease